MSNIIERTWKQGQLVRVEDLHGYMFEAEDQAHTFKISGEDAGGSSVTLSGTVSAVFVRPDRTTVPIVGSISDGIASVTLSAECYNQAGAFGLTIFLTTDGVRKAIYSCVGYIYESSGAEASPGTTAYVLDLIELMQTALDDAAASAELAAQWATGSTTGTPSATNNSQFFANQAAAAAQTASAAYNVNLLAPNYTDLTYPVKKGQHCIYSGGYYEANQDLAEADESWTAAHWTQLTVGGEVSDLNSAITQIIPTPTWTDGYVATTGSLNTTSTSYQYSSPIEINYGRIIVNLAADSSVAVIARYNESQGTYTSLVSGEGSGNRKQFIYDVTTPGKFIISYRKENGKSEIRIVTNPQLNNLPARVDEIDNKVYTIADANQDKKALENALYLKNLFDNTTDKSGFHYNSSGVLTPETNSHYSEQYIPVDPAKVYSFTNNDNLSSALFIRYDENKEVVDRVAPNTNLGYSFGNGVYFVRLSYYNKSFGNNYMFVEGSSLPNSYYSYGYNTKTDKTFEDEKLPANSKAVGDVIFDIAAKSVNLFDESTIVDGSHYNSSGTPTPNPWSQYSTQYIPVDPSKAYSFPGDNLSSAMFVTYDANKSNPVRVTPNSSNGYSFGSGVYYVRLSYYAKSFPDGFMFVEGNTLPAVYYPYGYILNENKFPADIRRKCFLKYESYSSQTTPESVFIYIPIKDGYVRYELQHNINNSVYCNCWRLARIFKVDDAFAVKKIFTDNGEIEMAIKLLGRPDYIGGLSHGDEIAEAISFIIDGNAVDITTITSLTSFKSLRIVEYSKMYDPNDDETHVADHGREYYFTNDGFTLSQSVNWKTNQTVSEAYMTMLIGPQTYNGTTVTDKYYTDSDFVIRNIPSETSRIFYNGAKEAVLIGQTYGVTDAFNLLEYPEGLSGGDRIEMRVTQGSNNKYYAIIVYDTDGQSVSSGDVWRSKTKFTFN